MDYVQGLLSIIQPTHLPYRAVPAGGGIGLVTDVPLCQLRVFLTLLSELWSLQLPQSRRKVTVVQSYCSTTAKCQREVSGSVGLSLFSVLAIDSCYIS